MEDFINESVENQEVAEPDTLESVENQEVAEPEESENKTEQDRAFADYRRRAEEAERKLEEEQAKSQRYQEALGLYFDGDDPIAEAYAYANDISLEDAQMMIDEQNAFVQLQEENAQLQEQLLDVQVEKAMSESLSEIQSIDPTIRDLTELGENFADYIASGLTTRQAYFACKAEEKEREVVSPPSIGEVNQGKGTSSYLSREEVEANQYDKAWVKKHYDAIRKSMTKW